jgi:hypothetical protein
MRTDIPGRVSTLFATQIVPFMFGVLIKNFSVRRHLIDQYFDQISGRDLFPSPPLCGGEHFPTGQFVHFKSTDLTGERFIGNPQNHEILGVGIWP